jgi:hypothetical protein
MVGGACVGVWKRGTRAGHWWEKLEGRDHVDDLCGEGRILLGMYRK